jgi:hypothetical protein
MRRMGAMCERDERVVENLGRAFFFSDLLTREAAGVFLTLFRNHQAAGAPAGGTRAPAAPPGAFRWEPRLQQQAAAGR